MKNKLKVYLGHSRDIDYESLYQSIENAKWSSKYNFLFPHKMDKNKLNGRDFYKKENIDIFIAEVSKSSTGLGIEMGWAYEEQIPIYCFHDQKSHPSNAYLSVTNNLIPYDNLKDFIHKLNNMLNNIDKER